MKIIKFNESLNTNWSESKISQMYEDKYEMSDLIKEYLKLYKDYFKKDEDKYTLDEFWFDEDDEEVIDYFNVSYQRILHYPTRTDNITYEFTEDEFKDLLFQKRKKLKIF